MVGGVSGRWVVMFNSLHTLLDLRSHIFKSAPSRPVEMRRCGQWTTPDGGGGSQPNKFEMRLSIKCGYTYMFIS